MYILAFCDRPPSLKQALALVEHRVTVIFRTTIDEILAIKTLDELDHYTLIVFSPIYWKIPTSTPRLAEHFRPRFHGTMVSVGNPAEWKELMKKAGCDHTINDNAEAAYFIRDLLFPPT